MAEIALATRHLDTVRRILREHLPEAEVRAFGSRVRGAARKYSDLDLAVVGSSAFDLSRLGRLEAALSESDLPIRVEVLDWRAISPAFRRVIAERYVVIQPGPDRATGIGPVEGAGLG